MDRIKKYPVATCCVIFTFCVVTRIIEYFLVRTDESFFAENFLHKIFGVVLLAVVLFAFNIKWSDIGFVKTGFFRNLLQGMLLGLFCFAVAYTVECILLYGINGDVCLRFYTTGFSLDGEVKEQRGMQFVLMCIAFNIINVWMEEGVFRGLFSKILDEKPYVKSVVFIAFLFGIWHWVMPFRDCIDGDISFGSLLIMGIGYIVLAGIMSMKWSLLYKMTGSLWMGIGDHLFNNVAVTNLVHCISNGEADNMMILRILIGQLLSTAIVFVIFAKENRIGGGKETL